MNILLLIIAIIFAFSAFIGYKKGLVRIVASLLATIIIVFLVSLATPYVSQWIRQSTPLESTVQNKITELIPSGAELSGQPTSEQQIASIESAQLPDMFRQMLLENNNQEVYEALGVTTFLEYISSYIAKVLADIIAFLIIIVIAIVILPLVIRMLGIVNKLPVIGGVNRLAGGVAGLGIGLVIIWILFIAITLMYNTALGKAFFENIETNSILKSLYDNNILMQYIVKF